MILSYSLDVNNFCGTFFFSILIFSYSNYIIYEFFSLSCIPDLVAEFIPKTWHIWDKWRIFLNFIFTLYPYWIFVKRDKLLSKKIKFKYENIKFKKRMSSGSCLTCKLQNDEIIKNAIKISWDYPFKSKKQWQSKRNTVHIFKIIALHYSLGPN
jgi:hypothetical protein